MRARVCAVLVCLSHPPPTGVGLVRLCKSVCVVTGRLARRECDQESPFAINVFCVTDGDTQDQWRLSHGGRRRACATTALERLAPRLVRSREKCMNAERRIWTQNVCYAHSTECMHTQRDALGRRLGCDDMNPCMVLVSKGDTGVGLVRLCKSVCAVTGRLARRECDQESHFAINVVCFVLQTETRKITDQWRLESHSHPRTVSRGGTNLSNSKTLILYNTKHMSCTC